LLSEQVVFLTRKRKYLCLIALLSLLLISSFIGSGSSAKLTLEFSRTFGGPKSDVAYRVIQTSDGGYALAGQTSSYGAGLTDAWLVKADSVGNMEWNKTFGGPSDDTASCIIQTADSGFILAGLTASFGAGGSDFWLLKTDSQGNMQWNKTFGGAKNDLATYIAQTSDGGFALVGWEESFGAGGEDIWLIKTNANGDAQWNKTYGGSLNEEAYFVAQTGDGGYALVGDTASASSTEDALIIKTDPDGNLMWNKTYGEAGIDAMQLLVQIGNGYVLGGWTSSFGAGSTDAWLMETDHEGNALWNVTFGGQFDDAAYCMVKADDGGFALAGSTRSSAAAMLDFWLIKVDSNGTLQLDQTFGGDFDDVAYSLVQAGDKGFVLAGESAVSASGDKDALLVKTLSSQATAEPTPFPTLPLIAAIAIIVAVLLLAAIYFFRRSH
jgi:predicted secreted protein